MQYRRGVIVIQTLIGLIVVAVVLPLLTNLIQKPQDTRNRAVETSPTLVNCERCSSNFGCMKTTYKAVDSCKNPDGTWKSPAPGVTPYYSDECECGPRKSGLDPTGYPGDDKNCGEEKASCTGYGTCKGVGDKCCSNDRYTPGYPYCEIKEIEDLVCDTNGSSSTFNTCVKKSTPTPPCGKFGSACCTTGTKCEGGFVCDTEGKVGEKSMCRSVAYQCINTNPYVKDNNCTILFSKDGSTPKECSTTGGMSCWGYQSTCQLNCGGCLKGNDICCTDGKGNRFCHNGLECGTGNLCKEKVICGNLDQKCCTDKDKDPCGPGLECVSGFCKIKVPCGNATEKCCTTGDKCNAKDLVCNKASKCEQCGRETQSCCTADGIDPCGPGLECDKTTLKCKTKVEVTYWTHGTKESECNVNGKWTCTKTTIKTTNSWTTQSACETEITNECLVSYKRVSCDETIGQWKCELSKTGTYTDEVDATAKNNCEKPITGDGCVVKLDECGGTGQKCCLTGDKCKKDLKLSCVSISLPIGLPVNICVNMSNCIYNKSSTYTGPNAAGGDYNCDGFVNIGDYSVWRKEAIDNMPWVGVKGDSWWADGNVKYGVKPDGADYSLWRHKFLDVVK